MTLSTLPDSQSGVRRSLRHSSRRSDVVVDKENCSPNVAIKRSTRTSKSVKMPTSHDCTSLTERTDITVCVSDCDSIDGLSTDQGNKCRSASHETKAVENETDNIRDLYAQTKGALSVSQPIQLTARSDQLSQLEAILNEFSLSYKSGAVDGQHCKSLYISGAPGTGKTASIRHLINRSRLASKVVFVNCMSLSSGRNVYTSIADDLNLMSSSSDDAKRRIENFICQQSAPKRTDGPNVLLVLDEMDQLCSRDHSLLYTIFEWPHLRGSRLRLIGIANCLDMTDRMLPRLKLCQHAPLTLCFPPYTRDEMIAILSERLGNSTTVVTAMALRFLASRLCAQSGDVRKALSICCRAVEMAESRFINDCKITPPPGPAMRIVDVPQIQEVFNEISKAQLSCGGGSSSSDASVLPVQQAILVATLFLMSKSGLKGGVTFTTARLYETYARVCAKHKISAISMTEMPTMCELLEARGVISVADGCGGRRQRKRRTATSDCRDVKVTLRANEMDVRAAMADKILLNEIISDVDCV